MNFRIITLLFFILLLSGCVSTPVVIYKYVYIPTLCNITIPIPPVLSDEVNKTPQNTLLLNNYITEVVVDLHACVYGTK